MAEDFHTHLKALFYSAATSALEAENEGAEKVKCTPKVQLRPVYLPNKSFMVVSDKGYFRTHVDKWAQAKRHAIAVVEISYLLLGTYDALTKLPWHVHRAPLLSKVAKILVRQISLMLLPVFHFASVTTMGIGFWVGVLNGRFAAPGCPQSPLSDESVGTLLLCHAAGAWVPFWSVVPPILIAICANVLFMQTAFFAPAELPECQKTIWHKADGGFHGACFGSKRLAFGAMAAVDFIVVSGLMVLPYVIAP